jgi:hypothetical protein
MERSSSACRSENFSRDVACVSRCEKDKKLRELNRLGRTLENRVLSEASPFLWHRRRDERRPDGPGAARIDPDASSTSQLSDALGHADDRRLGRGIGDQLLTGLIV